jgi:septum formation protein
MSESLTDIGLASISPRRLSLLQSLGLRVTVVKSAYDENAQTGDAIAAAELAQRHAEGKAERATADGPRLLVAADTIVDVDGAMFGKPRDDADAKRMLNTLSGRWHTVHTGYAVVDRIAGRRRAGVESTRVKFAPLLEGDVERYVESGEPRDKAGAYGIQGLGALLVERVDGDFYTVMGLPLNRVASAWRQLGFEIR